MHTLRPRILIHRTGDRASVGKHGGRTSREGLVASTSEEYPRLKAEQAGNCPMVVVMAAQDNPFIKLCCGKVRDPSLPHELPSSAASSPSRILRPGRRI